MPCLSTLTSAACTTAAVGDSTAVLPLEERRRNFWTPLKGRPPDQDAVFSRGDDLRHAHRHLEMP